MLFTGGNPVADFLCDEEPMRVPAQMRQLLGPKIDTLPGQISFKIPGKQLAGTGDKRYFTGAID
jgi:hypothetical protein